MRASTPSARNRAIIAGLEAMGVEGVTARWLESYRGWRGVGMIDRNPERWRGFMVGRTVRRGELERIAAVRSLCRHRRTRDEVAFRLAMSFPVDPGALEAACRERPDVWKKVEDEVLEYRIRPKNAEGLLQDDADDVAYREAAAPHAPRLEITPGGRVVLTLDEPTVVGPKVFDEASLALHDRYPALVLGRSWRTNPPDHYAKDPERECVKCGQTVYLSADLWASLEADVGVVCERCAGAS